jgi:hypothetical protein
VLLTKGERGAGVFEREVWARFGAGDKAVEVSGTPAILPSN